MRKRNSYLFFIVITIIRQTSIQDILAYKFNLCVIKSQTKLHFMFFMYAIGIGLIDRCFNIQ